MQGGLGRVDDEVAQGEAEALGGALQQHGLWPRPGELLVRRLLRRGGSAGQASTFWGFILPEERKLADSERSARVVKRAPSPPPRVRRCN